MIETTIKKTMKFLLWRPQLSHFVISFGLLLISIKTNTLLNDCKPLFSLEWGIDAHAEEKKVETTEKPKDDQAKESTPKDKDAKDEKQAATAPDSLDFDPLNIDENQVKVLKALSEKRKKIDEEETSLKKKEKLLELSEKKIATSLSELEKLKTNLEQKTEQLSKEEKENIDHIVKIYETMKPATAAAIFDKFDLESLLKMAKHMSQKKFALILSNMDPAKAQYLTTYMLPKPKKPEVPSSDQKNTTASAS